MDAEAAARAITLFEGRGQLDRVERADAGAARTCLDRAKERLKAATVLVDAAFWESAYTTAYDAYRTAGDAVVLVLGYRVPATQGGHRIAADIAHAAMQPVTDVLAGDCRPLPAGPPRVGVFRPRAPGRQDGRGRRLGDRTGWSGC